MKAKKRFFISYDATDVQGNQVRGNVDIISDGQFLENESFDVAKAMIKQKRPELRIVEITFIALQGTDQDPESAPGEYFYFVEYVGTTLNQVPIQRREIVSLPYRIGFTHDVKVILAGAIAGKTVVTNPVITLYAQTGFVAQAS